MISLRTIAEWWRNCRAERAKRGQIVTGWRLYVETEMMLDVAYDLRKQADALHRRADRQAPNSAAQMHDTFVAYALHWEAEALEWQAGGDDAAAADCSIVAAEWRAKAAQFVAIRNVENMAS